MYDNTVNRYHCYKTINKRFSRKPQFVVIGSVQRYQYRLNLLFMVA